MYKPVIETISVAKLQSNIGLLAKQVGNKKQHFVVTMHGLEIAAVIPLSDYHEFVRLANTNLSHSDKIER